MHHLIHSLPLRLHYTEDALELSERKRLTSPEAFLIQHWDYLFPLMVLPFPSKSFNQILNAKLIVIIRV